jgi:hypothetical protein
MIRVTITETGRNSLREDASTFNQDVKTVNTIQEVKEYLIDRYGKMPKGKNKIYQDKKDGSSFVCGFLHSFWNQDYSHNSKKWFQTDWISFSTVEIKPFDIKSLL